MDRTSSFPKEDFEGIVCEIWSGLDICLYHAAYVRTYADSTAMRLAGSRRREAILQQKSQTDRDFLQEDVIVFRAHFTGVLWQLNHLSDELVRLAYKRCYQEDIVTKERYDALASTRIACCAGGRVRRNHCELDVHAHFEPGGVDAKTPEEI